MRTDLDPFSFARADSDGDAHVRALFRDWLDVTRELWRHCHDEDRTEYDAASDRETEIEEEIARTPGGSVALAIKVFLSERFDLCAWVPEPGMIRQYPPDEIEEEERVWIDDLKISILRDAAKLAPELAPVCSGHSRRRRSDRCRNRSAMVP